MTTLTCCLLAGVLAACGGSSAAEQGDATPQCKLFTPAELAKFVGEPLGPGHEAAMGTGCQWLGRSGEGKRIGAAVSATGAGAGLTAAASG